MEETAISFEQFYLYAFIVSGALTLMYILLGDILEGIFESVPEGIFSPTLVLSFVTFLGCTGYILERFTPIHSGIVLLFSIACALIVASLLHFFVLVPLTSAEESLAYSDEDLKGRVAQVITSIPEDGYGEILFEGVGGNIPKTAQSFENEAIVSGTKVLVIDMKSGVAHVSPHQSFDDLE
ncbi:NfeD family protein [Caldalkalibacillus salinus]|uniref:NfeD family protein n=1 Tax=Caldalkalibacillus salinus TaxID=2803787 RepID=UPI001924351D|nr:NfeD family protein [Caldalkalibacillus salinus]